MGRKRSSRSARIVSRGPVYSVPRRGGGRIHTRTGVVYHS